MNQLDRVPCVQVNSTNIDSCWPHLVHAINHSHFVAVDLELSGLGERGDLIIKDIEQRYMAISEVAKTRSILSVGLSFFQHSWNLGENSDKLEENQWNFKVSNFELLTLCRDDYLLEEGAKKFLESHGFDFDLHKSSGLSYSRLNQDSELKSPTVRHIFKSLVESKVPLVLHNGLIDLIFIYHHFYSDLPKELDRFVADLNRLFPKGIFDTKNISTGDKLFKRTYLEYVFYHSQRLNLYERISGHFYSTISFNPVEKISDFVVYQAMKTHIDKPKPEGLKICNDYKVYGWCKANTDCEKSHDIDYILDDHEWCKSNKTRTRKLIKMKKANDSSKVNGVDEESSVLTESSDDPTGQVKSGLHRAGYDAFMTGFCLSYFIVSLSKAKPGKSGKINFSTSEIHEIANQISLNGKKDPLIIRNSIFAKVSPKIVEITSTDKSTDSSASDESMNSPVPNDDCLASDSLLNSDQLIT